MSSRTARNRAMATSEANDASCVPERWMRWIHVQVGDTFAGVIGRLIGIVVEQTLEGACIIDVAGVGYEVHVPLGALGQLPRAPQVATLHVHTQMREDSLTLYG